MSDPLTIPYPYHALRDAVLRWPDKVIAWDVSPDTVAFVGTDSDLAEPYLTKKDVISGNTTDGVNIRLRLTSPGHLENTVVPGLLSIGYPIVRVERVEKDSPE